MFLEEIVGRLGLRVLAGADRLGNEVSGGYASDLMSDVIANAEPGAVWVTLQVHLNVIAVAGMKELAGVILTRDRTPSPDVLAKAETEGVAVMTSPLSAFELVGRLYGLGIRGE